MAEVYKITQISNSDSMRISKYDVDCYVYTFDELFVVLYRLQNQPICYKKIKTENLDILESADNNRTHIQNNDYDKIVWFVT
jgi:hypothetical protein